MEQDQLLCLYPACVIILLINRASPFSVACQHMLQSNDNIMEEKFQNCFEKHGESVYQIYPGLLKILQLAIRQPTFILSKKDFARDLKEVKYVNTVSGSRH